jgi:tetratricopeptide (TPR) repeat protein
MADSIQKSTANAERQVASLLEDGHLDAAAKLAATALASARKAYAEDAKWLPLLLPALESQGDVSRAAGDVAEAEALYSEALSHEASPDMSPAQRARLRTALATLLDAAGRESDAMPVYEKAIAELEALDPPELPTSGQLRNNVAMAYKRVGKFALAEQHYLRSVEILEALHGRNSEEASSLYNNLGGLYYAAGFPDQAKEMFIEALEIRQEILGEDHPDVAQSLSNLAIACHELGDDAAAQEHYEHSLRILEGHLQDPGEAKSYDTVGQDYIALLSSLGENTKAATFQKRMNKALGSMA